MTTAVANPDSLNLRSYVIYSVVFHALLTVAALGASFLERRGNSWGGVGGNLGGTKVNLVSPAGIPMPKESVVTESKAVDPTKGLHKEEPPKPPEPKTDAEKIPKFEKEKPLPPSKKSRTFESKRDQNTIDPAVRAAHRAHAVITFRINADGSISNIRLSQTSGNSSMDYSAQRALQSLGSVSRLPNDYMGSYVDVTFDFDLSLTQ